MRCTVLQQYCLVPIGRKISSTAPQLRPSLLAVRYMVVQIPAGKVAWAAHGDSPVLGGVTQSLVVQPIFFSPSPVKTPSAKPPPPLPR